MPQEPASIRYKNPGAMWASDLSRKWGSGKKGVSLNDGTGQNNNIAVFPSFLLGICAQLDLWRSSSKYRNKPFCDAIAIWSGGNHVESYIRFVLERVPGMRRDTRMDDAFWRSSMGLQFLKAQAWHEAGKPYPAPAADWIEAQRRVFAGQTPPVGGNAAKGAAASGPVVGSVVAIDQAAKKPVEQGGGIDWALAIPILIIGLSVGAVIWFIWPKRK